MRRYIILATAVLAAILVMSIIKALQAQALALSTSLVRLSVLRCFWQALCFWKVAPPNQAQNISRRS